MSIDRTPDRALARIDLSVASHPVVVDPVALVDHVVVVVPSIRAAVYRTKRPSSTNERTNRTELELESSLQTGSAHAC